MLNSEKTYDCVILGAGFAGNCLARHLKLKMPEIRIVIVDPRPAERGDKDLKVGESLVEIAAMFITKELGLHDYMIENHTPKFGLSFHWPKDPAVTTNTSDYISIWQAFHSNICSYHFNRATFETDLLRMNQEMGVEFIHGRAIDLDLTPGDAIKTVDVRTHSGEMIKLRGAHVVDAAGRRFLIGKKKDNVIRDPETLYGLQNGSAWIRLRGFDKSIFHSGFHENRASSSLYYATNHWCGHGHWVWMIPSAKDELSIGVLYHKDKIDSKSLDRRDKLLSFLRANHEVLARLIDSGETIDFYHRPQVAYRSKVLLSPDNWYVLGDSAYIFDPLYSIGTSSITMLIESISDVIRRKLTGDPEAEERRELYNRFQVVISECVNGFYRRMSDTLGNASIQSWRLYLESMLWFGGLLPMWVGRWHLDKQFIKLGAPLFKAVNEGFLDDVYNELGELAKSGANVGFADPTRTDSILPGYIVTKQYDDYIVNTKFEPGKVNVFRAVARTCVRGSAWYWKLQNRAGGLRRALGWRSAKALGQLAAFGAGAAVGDLMWMWQNRGRPNNTEVAQRDMHVARNYMGARKVIPWAFGNEPQSADPETSAEVAE